MPLLQRVVGALTLAAVLAGSAPPALAADRALVTAASPESVGFAPDRLAKLSAGMRALVDKGQVTGMVTVLARHGKIVAVESYGKQSAATGAAMRKDALFRIYSMSKPITGVAMMILYEEGKWRLEDPVSKYVPEFANLKVFKALDASGRPILEPLAHPPTMRELMTHTAGLGYGLASGDYVNDAFRSRGVLRSAGLKAIIDKIADIPLLAQPGERWSYSAAVDVQGYIVETLSGQPFGQFLQQRIFTPLKMTDTSFAVAPAKVGRLTAAYRWAEAGGALVDTGTSGAVQDFTKTPPLESGGGGLVSTAADYARFSQMMLNGGVLEGARILAPSTVALMTSNQLPDKLRLTTDGSRASTFNEAVGFGLDYAVTTDPLRAGTPDGKGTYYWGGAAGTWFWIDPANDLIFVGMIQRFGEAPGGANLRDLSRALVYQALVDPMK